MQIEFWTLVIVGLVLGVLILAYFFAKAVGITKPLKQQSVVGQPGQPTQPSGVYEVIGFLLLVVIAGIVILVGYWLVFPSPDEVYTASDLQKTCSGNCFTNGNFLTLYNYGTVQIGKNDFDTIEIYFAEIPKERDVIDVFIGPYKALTKIDECYYTQETLCYLGEWWYVDDPNNPMGANSGGVAEVWYIRQTMVSPLKVKKGLLQSPAIWIGDNHITSLLRNEVMTPKPIEGEKTISCSNCKIREVRIYYNLLAKFQNLFATFLNKLIGWI